MCCGLVLVLRTALLLPYFSLTSFSLPILSPPFLPPSSSSLPPLPLLLFRLYIKRQYPISSITFCALDPNDTRCVCVCVCVCMGVCMGVYVCVCVRVLTSLVPRLSCVGGGERAWYTLFAHAPSSLGNLHTTPLH